MKFRELSFLYHLQDRIAMREYTDKPKDQSRTLGRNPKVSRQASIDVVLQQHTHLLHEARQVIQQKQGGVQPVSLPLQHQTKVVQRETDLQIQQGPSCWLFVLEALAKSKGVGTKYISIIMNSYVSKEAAENRKRNAARELPPRIISSRAAALEQTSVNIDLFRQKLTGYRDGEGGRRNNGYINKNVVYRYLLQTIGSGKSIKYFTFESDKIPVQDLILEIEKAKSRADALIQIVKNEEDDIASLLNTSYVEISADQDIEDVHLSLLNQDIPSYVSVRHRYILRPGDFENVQDETIDLCHKKINEMNPTSHAILLNRYDKNTKIVEYKDPNYGNYKLLVRIGQFRAMATGGTIKMRPFIVSGLSKSKLNDLKD